MRPTRARYVLKRRLKDLAGAHAHVFPAEDYDDGHMYTEYTRSSRHMSAVLAGAFRRNYSDEIGEAAASRVLFATSRTYILYKYSLRTGLLMCFAGLLYAHGAAVAILLQALIYISTRPLAGFTRKRGAHVAESLLLRCVYSPRGTPAIRRALRAELSNIPARALYTWCWKEHLAELLPVEEDVREIALRLADQYEGSITSLVATSRELAR